MDEKKRQELSEEMSLEELKKKAGGTKGSCGFTDETGRCGFTCESDKNYDSSSMIPLHCPECWSVRINTDEADRGYYDDQRVNVTCENCGFSWTVTMNLNPQHVEY